jgi:glycosylphosphatidylinositol transamidase (GPIT) subunit GPI8
MAIKKIEIDDNSIPFIYMLFLITDNVLLAGERATHFSQDSFIEDKTIFLQNKRFNEILFGLAPACC